MDDPLVAIGEVARRAGLATSAVRYYEHVHLISSTRAPGGQRRFHRSVLRRLAFIRAARNVGLSLDEIRAALSTLPESRTPTKADWTRLSRQWARRLDDQIAALVELRDGLTSCIGCGCLSLARCRLSNPGDTAAAGGPGAQFLPAVLRGAVPTSATGGERPER